MRSWLHGALRATVWLAAAVAIYAGMRWYERETLQPRVDLVLSGSESGVSIHRDRDGHYRLPGTVNGEPVSFLVDTGATRTVVPQGVANRAGLKIVGSDIAKTAAGQVRFDLATADIALAGGVRIAALKVSVTSRVGAEALLGMDVLGELHFEQDGRVLRIRTAPSQPGARPQ